MDLSQCRWLNPPQTWTCTENRLHVTTDGATDFWRETQYGFVRDTGHFFGCETAGDFTAQLRIRARYNTLYDQAGIMVRIDERHWVKAGIEQSDGQCQLSSVLTADRSDWATGRYHADPTEIWLRATVAQGVLRLQASADGRHWPLLRLAPFPLARHYFVGPMCCTPERAGLQIVFDSFLVTPPLNKPLHDLS